MSIAAALLLIAVVLFVLSGVGGWADPNWPWRHRLLSWGLAFFAGSFLLGILHR